MTEYDGEDRRNRYPGRREMDQIQTTLARIEERVKNVGQNVGSIVRDMERIERAVEHNTLGLRATEIEQQRNTDTIRWVSRTVLGVVIIAVLSIAGVASVAF